MGGVVIKKIPMGVRTLPAPKPDDRSGRSHPDTCGKGDKVYRFLHLDEMDGDRG